MTDALQQTLVEIEQPDNEIDGAKEVLRALLERRAILEMQVEQALREANLQDYSNGRYRARFTTTIKVLAADALARIAPDLVREETIYKPDMRAIRVALGTNRRTEIAHLVAIDERVEVEKESRKTAKVVAKGDEV